MRLLAIETSCDETAAAVVEDGRRILSNVVASQVKIHAPFGGVVPELASRHHLQSICPVIDEALRNAEVDPTQLDAIAVTRGPGLIGSLLVGIQVAKSLAFAHGKPLVPVHHIAGHIHAPFLGEHEVPLPALALIVSGGHTHLFDVKAPGEYALVGRTRDDAAGEAFDKVAKLLGLGYPGGPVIDRLARDGNDQAVSFRVAWMKDGRPDFSFSGLKTAVLYHVRREGIDPVPEGEEAPAHIRDLAASFQTAVVEALISRLRHAAEATRPRSLIVSGGVAANSQLRAESLRLGETLGLPVFIPPIALSTDNAAMIGAAGHVAWQRGERASWDMNGVPHLPLC